MAVKRVVINIASTQVGAARAFYAGLLDMDVVMDHGWIVTFAGQGRAEPQISVASEGGIRDACSGPLDRGG